MANKNDEVVFAANKKIIKRSGLAARGEGSIGYFQGYISPSKETTHVEGDYLKAGVDVYKGDGFKVDKTYIGPPVKPTPVSIKIKIVFGDRKAVLRLPKGKYTLADLKQQIIKEKLIENLDNAIFEEKNEDDIVELCNSVILCDEDKVWISFPK